MMGPSPYFSTRNRRSLGASMTQRRTLIGYLIASVAVVSGCVVDAPAVDRGDDVTYTSAVHSMPWRDPSSPRPFTSPSGAHLTYYGGKIIQQVHVVQVLYGSGTYISQVSGAQMGNFYQQAEQTGVWDWLTDYNTSSPSQSLTRGQFVSKVQISPASAHNGATIADASIQAELTAQIK